MTLTRTKKLIKLADEISKSLPLRRTKNPHRLTRTRFKKKNPPAKPAWFSRKGWLRRKARLLLTKMSRRANRKK